MIPIGRLRVCRSFVVAATVAAVVSCSGGGDGGDDGVDGGAGTGTAATVTTSSPPVQSAAPTTDAVDPTTTPAPDTSTSGSLVVVPTDAPSEPDDRGECLVGEWVVTAEEMNAYYAGLMTTVDAPIVMNATGQAGLTFAADGTYAWFPDFELSVDVVGVPGTGRTIGTIHGSWSAAAGTLATASDDNAIELSITVNATTFSGSDLANGLLNSSPISGVTYSCAGPLPVIDFKTADPAVTVPVTLSPA